MNPGVPAIDPSLHSRRPSGAGVTLMSPATQNQNEFPTPVTWLPGPDDRASSVAGATVTKETMTMKTIRIASLPAALLAFLLAGCSGGGDSSAIKGTGGDFLVLRTEPANNGRLFLNEPISIDFSNTVDLATANLNTISFAVFNLNGDPVSEQPSGTFRLSAAPGDADVGRRLEFVPRFPTNNAYDDGGFRPGRRYVVQIVGGDPRNGAVLKDSRGKSVAQPISFQFSTADGTTPSQLFRDTKAGGPRRAGFSVTPSDSTGVALNKLGLAAVEVRLRFDQPLNPASTNVPVTVETDPLTRDPGRRGRVFLEYDDPDPLRGRNAWIPADVDLEVNTLDGSTLVLRPVGVLPNNASIRVIVENTLEDIAGESNVNDVGYNRIFAEFNTRQSYEPQFDAVVEGFDSTNQVDPDAAFLDPRAELGQGFIRANFEFEGTSTILDYEPASREVVLNTDFTQIVPKGAPPINVQGGVFNFRNVTIPSGVTVIGTGTRPMVWLITGDFIVNGTLTVNGGLGARVDTLNAANFPTAGGVGACGGGAGGRGSPNVNGPSERGEAGNGAGNAAGKGGQGGQLSCTSTCNRGSGGGGGAMAVQGDPNFPAKTTGNKFPQQRGIGGFGCIGASGSTTRSLPGGNSGVAVFTDARRDNNYWGSAIDVNRQIRITGELLAPVGGQGGGGGGDRSNVCGANPGWINDNKGGGGGGGAGVLIIKALGSIKVGPSGKILANGGNGGGGEQAGGNNQGGGGAGGAGGMIVLMAARTIEFTVQGETYANRNYDFAISADGGVGTQGSFGGAQIDTKYPPPTIPDAWDQNPTGAMGGMGIVQLMAPAGNNADTTNTVLDDSIIVRRGTDILTGTEKQRYIAWRGFPNASGQFVDDNNQLINLKAAWEGGTTGVDGEGDIRPSPILMPCPFGPLSRARSRWIDLGAAVRREINAPDGLPRGVVKDPQTGFGTGPAYYFAGTNLSQANYVGYANYDATQPSVPVIYPIPAELQNITLNIVSTNANATFDGQPAYEVRLANAPLGVVSRDRFAHYRAELVNLNGTVVTDFRILGHSDSAVFLDPAGALPGVGNSETDVKTMVIRAKFFRLVTDRAVGLGPSYIANGRNVPYANVRFGFAFHKDPGKPNYQPPGQTRIDLNRLPNQVGTFLFDVNSAAKVEEIRQFAAAFVQWEVQFNLLFSEEPGNLRPGVSLSPSDPRPSVLDLVIPYRF